MDHPTLMYTEKPDASKNRRRLSKRHSVWFGLIGISYMRRISMTRRKIWEMRWIQQNDERRHMTRIIHVMCFLPSFRSFHLFLDASSHLYKRPCPSVRWSVGPSVRWLVGNAFVQIDEKWPITDSKWFRQCWTRKKEGQGGRRDEEEGGTRRKEGRGVRRDAEKGATWRKERWGEWKNEKVVKEWKMKKWLEDASLTSGSC